MNGLQEDPNIVPFIGGRQNHIPLDGLGETEATELGHALRAEDYIPTIILASPAKRTLQTCKLSTTALLGTAMEPIIDDDLQEMTQGDWEGLPRTVYDEPRVKAEMARLGLDFAAKNGESMNMVANRALRSLGRLAATVLDASDTPQHVLIYTHGVCIKSTVGKMLGWTHRQVYLAKIDNVSRTRLAYTAGTWEVGKINERIVPSLANLSGSVNPRG